MLEIGNESFLLRRYTDLLSLMILQIRRVVVAFCFVCHGEAEKPPGGGRHVVCFSCEELLTG